MHKQITLKKALLLPDPITPNTTTLVFDIHGVLFTSDHKKILSLLWQNKRLIKLFLYFFNPRFLVDFLELVRKKAVPEECIIYLTSRYKGLANFKEIAISIANAQKPIPEMLPLIKTLKEQGYTLHIFSNIGETIFEHLAQAFPEVFCYFDSLYVPNAADGYISKPKMKAFNYYLERCNQDQKQIIFIDNNIRNISMAAQCNISGIYFENSEILKQKLQALGIF